MRARAILALSLLLSSVAMPVLACGPFFPYAVLVHTAHPDLPLRQFAAGNLGIVRPSMARSYLVVAYRYFNGKPLSQQEQKQALALWDWRLVDYSQSAPTEAINKWQTARQSITKEKQPCYIDSYRTVSSDPDKSYQSYLNCPADAFLTAAATLQERVAKYGAGSQTVKDWVQAQDQVFCHCSGPGFNYQTNKREAEPPFPEELPQTADALARADRAYQIAASYFYAQQFDKAVTAFQEIAKDSSSPWSIWAPYLVARSMVRAATLKPTIDTKLLTDAAHQVQAVIAAGAPQLKEPARKLLAFIQLRQEPSEKLHQLSTALQDPAQAADFRDNLYDYTVLFDNQLGVDSDQSQHDAGDILKYAKMASPLKADDLSDWIATFQSTDDAGHQHAVENFNKTGSAAWLAAAIATAKFTSAETTSLIEKTASISHSSPEFPTVAYYALDLLRQQGKQKQAQEKIAQLLAMNNLPPSSVNLVLDEKMFYAKNFDEYLRLAIRKPATVSTDEIGFELPNDPVKVESLATFPSEQPVFDEDYIKKLNTGIPLSLFVQAAQMPLSANLHAMVTRAAWTRAFLLQDQRQLKLLTPMLAKAEPELSGWLDSYEKAKTPDEQQFAGTYLILKSPGMRPNLDAGAGRQTPLTRIDDYQDNWWCAEESSPAGNSDEKTTPTISSPSVLTAEQTAAAAKEVAAINKLGGAPDVLTDMAIRWAQSHPTDARVPEALALSVKATRFGCKDSRTSKLSKQAFQFLHAKYPTSPWTKKTPYWY